MFILVFIRLTSSVDGRQQFCNASTATLISLWIACAFKDSYFQHLKKRTRSENRVWLFLFFKKKKTSSPTLTFLWERTASLLIHTESESLSHTEAWCILSLATKCQNGNILFGCETAVSDSPLPLSSVQTSAWWGCKRPLIWTSNWVLGLERPALFSSPFYLIHVVPFQVWKKTGWIGHGFSSPTKTVRWRTKQQTARQHSIMDGSDCIYRGPNSSMITYMSNECKGNKTLSQLLWMVVFLRLQISDRLKLCAHFICFKNIVKRKWLWKTWWHYSNKIRSQNCLAFLFPIEKMSAVLTSETPDDQKN